MTVVSDVQMKFFAPIKTKRNKRKIPRLSELTDYVGDKSSSIVSAAAAVVLHMRSASRSSVVLAAGRDTKYLSLEHATST